MLQHLIEVGHSLMLNCMGTEVGEGTSLNKIKQWVMLSLCTCRSRIGLLFFHQCKQQSTRTRAAQPWPTYSTVSDERMTELGDFVPWERDLPQENLPALDHDFFAFGVVLEETARCPLRARCVSVPAARPSRRQPPLPSTPARWGWWSAGRAPRRRRRPPRSPRATGSRWHPAGCSSGPGWSHLACVGRAERGARSGLGPGGWCPVPAWPWGGARCPPRSRLRKPSSARMAATAEATSGSSLSCALNASISSERQKEAPQARPGPARSHPGPAPRPPLPSLLMAALPAASPQPWAWRGAPGRDVTPGPDVICKRRERPAPRGGGMSAGEAAAGGRERAPGRGELRAALRGPGPGPSEPALPRGGREARRCVCCRRWAEPAGHRHRHQPHLVGEEGAGGSGGTAAGAELGGKGSFFPFFPQSYRVGSERG